MSLPTLGDAPLGRLRVHSSADGRGSGDVSWRTRHRRCGLVRALRGRGSTREALEVSVPTAVWGTEKQFKMPTAQAQRPLRAGGTC